MIIFSDISSRVIFIVVFFFFVFAKDHLASTVWAEIMSSVLQVDLPWLTLRAKLVQEDEKGILYRTMFDDYILDNSKFQMVIKTKNTHWFSSSLNFTFFSQIPESWKICTCGKICY